ncbi:uncharacterized protein K460DRAFT_103095 [Cucurbitaria berberidis CBS 394.84]|uniref:Uncharacterized protein n=1 Tax=Cucurbitaria berberidis CBS 394.84 TaxID=1168544 RepID=A0A9P4GFH3_9PLEO|nr:uncharacterized protein K460DRAFT_103095 [Cucurbitaria berberidis CBS 394.84]KAF1845103.1 hypothetical protein K460DRAFT_103095 [Cucurbitaria berberidis CBS 394.84]
MVQKRGAPLFCENLGSTKDDLRCCYPDSQDASTCRYNFNNPDVHTFSGGCDETGDCLGDCQDVSVIYSSLTQDDALKGTGIAPIRRYLTCANVPNMAGYLDQDVLTPDIRSQVERYIPRNATERSLKDITFAVTECLTATCRNARHGNACEVQCSGVNLLVNSTTPSLHGINQCLNTLCTGEYDSLPFADADVVGIGVFASYIMQCAFVVMLLFGLTSFELFKHKNTKRCSDGDGTPNQGNEKSNSSGSRDNTPEKEHKNGIIRHAQNSQREQSHQENFETFLVSFHQAQCYFSATIQIASLSYGIFSTDMLNTFLLLPLATNGILPVAFAYVLLLRCRKASMDTTLLTIACWLLASLVYWTLYAHVIPINSTIRDPKRIDRAYQQFMYKLSALDACGGYSALAVCPHNLKLGEDEIISASYKLRVLTPIIWTFSTICLLVALGEKLNRWLHRPSTNKAKNSSVEEAAPTQTTTTTTTTTQKRKPASRSLFSNTVFYGCIILCFLAGIGMQLSLLSVSTSLKMTDANHWSFGQIVAVTIWAPPLLGYLYTELKMMVPARFKSGRT